MKIEDKKFYFISDDFISAYGKKYNLMENKESGNKRPCYFCFKDKKNDKIMWFIPLSTKYEKYKAIYDKKKINNNREPLNFVFGTVRERKAVFLIQNMFPCTEKYIVDKYRVNNIDVKIYEALSEKVIKQAEKVIELTQRTKIRIAFTNILELKQELLSE